jgi:hypothetical protein
MFSDIHKKYSKMNEAAKAEVNTTDLAAMRKYNERYNDDLFKRATKGKSSKYANMLLDDSIALVGSPFFQLTNFRYCDEACEFLFEFIKPELKDALALGPYVLDYTERDHSFRVLKDGEILVEGGASNQFHAIVAGIECIRDDALGWVVRHLPYGARWEEDTHFATVDDLVYFLQQTELDDQFEVLEDGVRATDDALSEAEHLYELYLSDHFKVMQTKEKSNE